jgi:anti-sigma regulatory factor (Ser/Thr protein kinase)
VEIAREALVQLTPDASSLSAGRRFVARTLRDWQVDEAHIEPVTLVANELLANAIVHARSAVPDETGGRGLMLVEALADQWGCEPSSSGKVVWVTFAGAFG